MWTSDGLTTSQKSADVLRAVVTNASIPDADQDGIVVFSDPELQDYLKVMRLAEKARIIAPPAAKRRKLAQEPLMLPALVKRLSNLIGGSPSDNVDELPTKFL